MKLTKWQILFRNFERSIWNDGEIGVMTKRIRGERKNLPEISSDLARAISELVDFERQHYDLQSQVRAEASGTVSQDDTQDDEIMRQLLELGGMEDITVGEQSVQIQASRVDASQIELWEVDARTTVEVEVKPVSLRCLKCGHFEIRRLDDNTSLECPCCKANGRSGILQQYPYMFACPRCGNVQEFSPPYVSIDSVRERVFACRNCETGHLHLYVRDSFTNARWFCPSCKTDIHLNQYCSCHIPRNDSTGFTGRPSIMKPMPITARSLFVPLVRSYVHLEEEERRDVSLEALQQSHQSNEKIDPYSWNMKQLNQSQQRIFRERWGIENIFSVPRVSTTTVTYGYRSGIQSYPVPIGEDERIAQLFRDERRNVYRAYLVQKTGRGLVFELNRERLLAVVKKHGNNAEAYKEFIDEAIDILSNSDVRSLQNLLNDPSGLESVYALHILEHALLNKLNEMVGMEIFGSKILLRDAAILIYEREEVAAGGLAQITTQGESAFSELMRAIRDSIMTCRQACEDACLSCVFVNDFYCQPFLTTEVQRSFPLPPNALLNRQFAKEFLKA